MKKKLLIARSTAMLLFMATVTLCTTNLLTSCKKDVTGCTDPNSLTYNPKATKDDGSCKYQGKLVFRWTQADNSTLVSANISAVKVYSNNVYLGSIATGQYWNFAPACGSNSTVTATVNLGSNKSNLVPFKFILYAPSDTTGLYNNKVIADTTFNIVANQCLSFKL